MVWRFIPIVLVAVALLPAASLPDAANAQERTVVTGVVPAPAGTAVRLEVLDVINVIGVVCATGITTPDPSSSSSSRFSLTVDFSSCTQGLSQVFRVCWGENLCDVIDVHEGAARDVGTLDPSKERGSDPTHGDGPAEARELAGGAPESALPDAGVTQQTQTDWLLWIAIALAALGLAVGGVSLVVRRRV